MDALVRARLDTISTGVCTPLAIRMIAADLARPDALAGARSPTSSPMLSGLATSAFLTLEVPPVLYTLWRCAQLRRAHARGVLISAIVGPPAPVGAVLAMLRHG